MDQIIYKAPSLVLNAKLLPFCSDFNPEITVDSNLSSAKDFLGSTSIFAIVLLFIL